MPPEPDEPQLALLRPPAVRPATVGADLQDMGARLPRWVRLGTSSWSFPGWQGRVWQGRYPPESLARDGLAAYAAHPLLRTVSVDRSYYRAPELGLWRSYAAQTPSDFRFVVKAPAVCTAARLQGRGNPDVLDPRWALDRFLGPLHEGLGDRLGLVLLQFPPQPADAIPAFFDRLARFLALPGPFAVELRTPALLQPPLCEVLRATSASPCLTIHPSMPSLREQWRATDAGAAPHLVLRWNLGGGRGYEAARARYAPFDRVVDADPYARSALAKAARWAAARGRPAWITVNNKAEGCAPGTVEAIARAIVAPADAS